LNVSGQSWTVSAWQVDCPICAQSDSTAEVGVVEASAFAAHVSRPESGASASAIKSEQAACDSQAASFAP
jgi:hypothetical protein